MILANTFCMGKVRIFLKQMKFTERQKNRDMNMLLYGQSHKFLALFAIISQTDCSYVYLSFLLV